MDDEWPDKLLMVFQPEILIVSRKQWLKLHWNSVNEDYTRSFEIENHVADK